MHMVRGVRNTLVLGITPRYLMQKRSNFDTNTFIPALKALHLKGVIKPLDQILGPDCIMAFLILLQSRKPKRPTPYITILSSTLSCVDSN